MSKQLQYTVAPGWFSLDIYDQYKTYMQNILHISLLAQYTMG